MLHRILPSRMGYDLKSLALHYAAPFSGLRSRLVTKGLVPDVQRFADFGAGSLNMLKLSSFVSQATPDAALHWLGSYFRCHFAV